MSAYNRYSFTKNVYTDYVINVKIESHKYFKVKKS